MPSVMKTLLLNPPSFEKFDGGAGSRWPATREIESYWYPVWLAYPAGMLPGSRLLDGPPHHIKPAEVVQIARDFEFVVLFTSTVGFLSDLRMARAMKEQKPDTKICFVGPQVQIKPAESLLASSDIDFVVRGEFDHAVVEYAQGKPVSQIANASYVKDGKVVHNPSRPLMQTAELDELPFATDVYQKDVQIEKYNVPFLLHPFVSFYTARGCPALCTFCLWPQTLSGHAWRTRSVESVAREFRQAHKMFPQAKEFFFDDDTFNIRKDRVLALCKEFEPVGFQWSCTARVHGDYETLKAMADSGCRLLIVGFESGDAQILKNIKKGQTLEMGRNFVRTARRSASTFTETSSSAFLARPGTPSRRQLTSRRISIARRFKSRWLTRIRAPSCTIKASARVSLLAKRSLTTAATSFLTSSTPASPRNTWSSPSTAFTTATISVPRSPGASSVKRSGTPTSASAFTMRPWTS